MNTSNVSPRTTLKSSLEYKQRANTFAYIVNDSIYINLTNRCTNNCEFCLRNNGSTAYGSDSLWLEREPSVLEVLEATEKIFFENCKSFVFCGYGEPTCRLDTLVEAAKQLKDKYNLPIRLNTNGQSELINGVGSTERLKGVVDSVSISLNSPTPEGYDAICQSVFGIGALEAVISFGKSCVDFIPEVVFSVVEETLSEEDIKKCQDIVNEIGAKLRVRKFISENDKNPENK